MRDSWVAYFRTQPPESLPIFANWDQFDECNSQKPHRVTQTSEEGSERQERCARGDAWRLAKSVLKVKEKDKATFFSPAEVWCLPAPSEILNEGKRICCVCQKMDLFVTVMLLEDTAAVLSLGKLCEDHGYSNDWTTGPKHIITDGKYNAARFKLSFTYISSIVTAGYCGLYPCVPKQHEVRERVSKHGETRRQNQQKPKKQTKMETPRLRQNGWKNSRAIWWMKVLQNTGTHPPVLLVSQLQSRLEKWYRVSAAFLLTSSRTEIATSA